MSDKECHEGITRDGEFQPCGLLAVGYRIDPEEQQPYPVCIHHLRAPYWLTAREESRQGRVLASLDRLYFNGGYETVNRSMVERAIREAPHA